VPLFRRTFAWALPIAFAASSASADEPDVGLGIVTGAATMVAGFGAGAVVVATSGEHDATRNDAGWLTMESGFLLAPIVAHGVVGEWGRGLWFAAVPAACIGGSVAVFGIDEQAVRHGVLSEQRVLWGLFSAALFAGAAGVVDVAFAGDRAVTVAPTVGDGRYGLEIWGPL
jgi:hypothetical protein